MKWWMMHCLSEYEYGMETVKLCKARKAEANNPIMKSLRYESKPKVSGNSVRYSIGKALKRISIEDSWSVKFFRANSQNISSRYCY